MWCSLPACGHSFVFSQYLSLEEGVASSAWTFCSLAGCRGLQQALVPVQSFVDIAVNPWGMAYVLSKWVCFI